MSDHVPSSWQNLPLMGEVGSLCPRLPQPVKSKKPAPEVKSTTVEEDGIPDPLMVPEVAPALLKYENHQWACWSCRIKFFVAIKDLIPQPKRSKPKNRLAGIKEPKEGSVRRIFYVGECTEFRCSGSCSGDLLRDTFEQAVTSKPALLKTLKFLEDILTAKAEQLGQLS